MCSLSAVPFGDLGFIFYELKLVGEIVRLVINNLDWLTNGPQGISRIDRPEFFGLVLQSPSDFFYFLLCFRFFFLFLGFF